ncbi:MAG: DUF5916 domain-containing protein, partial [Pseudomonadota bacterium]
ASSTSNLNTLQGGEYTVLRIAVAWTMWLLGANALADIDVPTVQGEPTLDGVLDEALWAEATLVTLEIETRPAENLPADVRTEVLLAENGEALLIAFRAFDPDPDEIVAYLADRDSAFDDDFVGIVLDTFNDDRRAFEFFVNARGIQMDLTFDDVNGNEDSSWDAIWDSFGAINEEGYIVEMIIPFRTMQFPAGTERKTFGVDLLRFRPRDNRYRLSNNAQDRARPCYLCQLEHLHGFASASPGRNLVIAPSTTVVRNDSTGTIDGPDPALINGDVEFEPALDVRWGITPDVSLTATLNPDFSQVEADVAQVQVNQQFALFFPERRPFFLEGADFFATPINAVFTRNIADPDFGGKVTGKADGHTFGVFVADDTQTNLLLPASQGSDITTLEQDSETAVARYAYDIGENSRIGALATSRRSDDYNNTVVGLDARFQFLKHYNFTGQVLTSDTRYPQSIVDDFDVDDTEIDGVAYRLQLERDTRDWRHFLIHESRERGFRADMGFVPQVDFEKTIAGVFRKYNAPAGQWWNTAQIGGDWDITYADDGTLLERELEVRGQFSAALRSFVQAGLTTRDRLFEETLYEETLGFLFAEMNPSGATYLGLLVRAGDQIDFANSRLGEQLLISPRINQRFGDGLALRLRHTWQRLRAEGDDVFTVNLTDFRAQYQFDVRTFVRLVVTHRDVERNVANFLDPVDPNTRGVTGQLLLSYKINPQTVFFLGYGDAWLEDDLTEDLTQTDRSFFMKIGYAWLP